MMGYEIAETSDAETGEGGDRLKRRQVMRGMAATGIAVAGLGAATGSAAAWEDCDCVCYKLDRTPSKGETFDAGDATITITDVEYEDGEVVCVTYDVEEDCTLVCEVRVKGSPETNIIDYSPYDGEFTDTVCDQKMMRIRTVTGTKSVTLCSVSTKTVAP